MSIIANTISELGVTSGMVYRNNGTAVNDYSGYGYNGTITGSVTFSSDSNGNYINFGGNRNFDAGTGSLAYITIGNVMNFTQATDFSWFIKYTVATLQPNQTAGVFGSVFDSAVYTQSNGTLTVALRGSSIVTSSISSYWSTRLGEIHTVGFVYVAADAKYYWYLDGALQNSGGTAGPATFLTNDWRIGDTAVGGGNDSSSNVKAYEIGVFNAALTAAQMKTIANRCAGKTQMTTTGTAISGNFIES